MIGREVSYRPAPEFSLGQRTDINGRYLARNEEGERGKEVFASQHHLR